MKKIYIVALLAILFMGNRSHGQGWTTIANRLTGFKSLGALAADSLFLLPDVPAIFSWYRPDGRLYYKRADSSVYYSNGVAWVKLLSSVGANVIHNKYGTIIVHGDSIVVDTFILVNRRYLDSVFANTTLPLPALASDFFWIGNGSNVATARQMSGDATMSNTGVVAVSNAATCTTIPNLGGDVASVGNTTSYTNKVPLSKGGGHSDLSATGGPGQYVKQVAVGADFTVGVISYHEVTDTPVGLPPTGAAGGALNGSYPNPSLGNSVVSDANVSATAAIAYTKLNLAGSILNADVNTSAGIVYTKLSLTNGIVNADVNSAAAIAYSKLNLALAIVNADISASAAIAYSKLSLLASIVNADIASGAAIAYGKLNLTGNIVNADINGSAAIAYSKLNLSAAIVNADVSNSAAIAYSKLNLSGAILNADINTSAGIVYTKLSLTNGIVNADINSAAAIAYSKLNLSASIAIADHSATGTPGATTFYCGDNTWKVPNAFGAITVTTVNGNTFTTGTYTVTGGAGKTFTFSNTYSTTAVDGSAVAFGSGGTVPYLGTQQTWTKGNAGAVSTLTDASTIAVDLGAGNNLGNVVLAGNRTLGVPTNIVPGQSGTMGFDQDITGTRVLTPAWIYGGSGGTAVVLSTGKLAHDVVSYYVDYYSTATVTISNASPGVVTQTGHGFPVGSCRKLQLTTTGTLPTGLSPSTTYYATIVDANTYKLSTTFANAQAATFINTSSAGSGTHTSTVGNITLTILTDSR